MKGEGNFQKLNNLRWGAKKLKWVKKIGNLIIDPKLTIKDGRLRWNVLYIYEITNSPTFTAPVEVFVSNCSTLSTVILTGGCPKSEEFPKEQSQLEKYSHFDLISHKIRKPLTGDYSIGY